MIQKTPCFTVRCGSVLATYHTRSLPALTQIATAPPSIMENSRFGGGANNSVQGWNPLVYLSESIIYLPNFWMIKNLFTKLRASGCGRSAEKN